MARKSRLVHRPLVLIAVVTVGALLTLLVLPTDPADAGGDSRETYATQRAGPQADTESSGFSLYRSTLPSLARMAAALVIVIICIYGGLYLLKRLMTRRYRGRGEQRVLEVLETTCVAPKKSVSLIKVANKAVLVGMTDSHMSVLTELDPDQTAEVLKAVQNEEETDRFAQLLKSFTHRWKRMPVIKDRAALET